MALTAYQSAVQNLIQAPSAPIPLIGSAQLTVYINDARVKVATEGECIRNYATLALASGTIQYPFSGIVISGAAPTGIQGPMAVRYANYKVANGARPVLPRPWPWFNFYYLGNPTPAAGPPSIYSQFGQGALGSLFINPPPDIAYSLNLDVACLPIPLVDDTTTEAIPATWTDAVPFYAAWLALLSMQRPADADTMLQRFTMLMAMARAEATPSVLSGNYEGVSDPTLANKLGSQPLRSAQDIGAGAAAGKPMPGGR